MCLWLLFLQHSDNCDLNLKVNDTNMGGEPFTNDGFAMMWAGARSTYGVKGGKVAFEVKV